MCLVQILYQRKRDLYRVPPEVLFASRKINTNGNKAKDTRISGNQGNIPLTNLRLYTMFMYTIMMRVSNDFEENSCPVNINEIADPTFTFCADFNPLSASALPLAGKIVLL